MNYSISNKILNLALLFMLSLIIITFPLGLLLYKMYEGLFLYIISFTAGILLLLYILKRQKKRFQIIETPQIMHRFLSISIISFILAFFQIRHINIETFSLGEKVTVIIIFFFLSFLLHYEISFQKRLLYLKDMGITSKWIKSISENTNLQEVKERLYLIEIAIDSYVWKKYFIGIFIISNFIEEIIDKLYYEKNKEHTGFKKIVKSLQLDYIKDPISDYTLIDFYYGIRSKYAHELYKKGISPSEEEMKISLRLMKEFVEYFN